MAKRTVTIEGLPELKRKLLDMSEAARQAKLEAAVLAGGQLIKNEAQVRAPVKTGTLRRSITVQISESSATNASAAIGTNLAYARRIEFGFNGRDKLGRLYSQPAQPYLRPAFDQERENAYLEIQDALRDAINDAID
jgi:HK97 gp10 family phage protein